MAASAAAGKITHGTHPKHPLLLTDTGRSFRCDGCQRRGKGQHFRCAECDFDLHDHCGTCPRFLSFFAHRLHPLALSLSPLATEAAGAQLRVCDLCRGEVRGMHYACRPCGFDLHPMCAQLPPSTCSAFHPEHVLSLVPAAPQPCSVCGETCVVWRYRCAPCGVELHPKCLHGKQQPTPLFLRN